MPKEVRRYCSWCYQKARHTLVKRSALGRDVYQCANCLNYTVRCRFCRNMARGTPRDSTGDNAPGLLESLRRRWGRQLCAEHDGSIASFGKLSCQLDDLADYKSLFHARKPNLLKVGKICAGILGGAAVLGPLAYIAAPGVLSGLRRAGALRAASASAAAAGRMGLAGAVVTAAGAALGAVQGGVISNAYFGDVKGFSIEKVHEGTGPALVFINGFLSQEDQDPQDWCQAVQERFVGNPWYYLRWEAGALASIGGLIEKARAKKAVSDFVAEAARQALPKGDARLGPLKWASILGDLLSNPWHKAMVKAGKTGVLLADLLARVKDGQFILMGNSLGCRVAFYALCALATCPRKCVKDAYLLGGAIGRKDKEGWRNAAKAVSGAIYNCYSRNDWVLRYLYRPANALLSDPIGLGEIACACEQIVNVNVSDLVPGHMEYKNNFAGILRRIHGLP